MNQLEIMPLEIKIKGRGPKFTEFACLNLNSNVELNLTDPQDQSGNSLLWFQTGCKVSTRLVRVTKIKEFVRKSLVSKTKL